MAGHDITVVYKNSKAQSKMRKGQKYSITMQEDTDDEGDIAIVRTLEGAQNTMAHHFRYLIIATKLSGMFYHEPNGSKCNGHMILLLIYHVIIELFTWSNVIRFFFAYEQTESFSPQLMIKIYMHIVYVFVALTCTFSCFIAVKGPSVLKKLDSYHQKYSCDLNDTKIVKRCIYLLVVICSVWLAFIVYMSLCSSSCNTFMLITLKPFSDNLASVNDIHLAMRIGVIVCETILCVAFSVFLSWVIILGLSMKDEFELITAKLCKNKEQHHVDIEAIRKQHFELSTITREIDGIFSLHLLMIFISHVPCACIGIYLLLLLELPVGEKLIIIGGMIHVMLVLFVIIAVGTVLNEKVRKSSMEFHPY